MSKPDQENLARMVAALENFGAAEGWPPGLAEADAQDVFARRLVESLRRVRYVEVIQSRSMSDQHADPAGSMFDPLKALVHFRDSGDREEACWMAFLQVHFGKTIKGGWGYARHVYGALGEGDRWTWQRTQADIDGFRSWLDSHEAEIRAAGGGFGNHRKYESLSGTSPTGTGAVVDSYVDWVSAAGSHGQLLDEVVERSDHVPWEAFDLLVRGIGSVIRFGRTSAFDYSNLLGQTGLAEVAPGRVYVAGATGPKRGAVYMFGSGYSNAEYEDLFRKLNEYLSVPFDVLEDAVCNWQKNTTLFTPFRG